MRSSPPPLAVLLRPAAALVALAAVGCASFGTNDVRAPDPALSHCAPDQAVRLRFLEPRLDSHARYARRWWWAWNGVYGGGIVYGSALAATSDGRGERANEGVNAVKSVIGLSRNLYAPPAAREGAAGLRAIDPAREGGCEERLARAEALLAHTAQEAREERRAWLPHLANLALNLAGALVVAEGFDEGSGWGSGLIGVVVGEIRIWSHPWQAEATLEEYRERFPSLESAGAWRSERRGGREVLVLE